MPHAEALVIYRQTLRAAKQFTNYNFREYALRHAREDFKQGAGLQGDAAARALEKAREQLAAMRRMSAISHLFPTEKHAME